MDAAKTCKHFNGATALRKISRFHIHACASLLLVIDILFTSGCAFINSKQLLNDVPASPSTVYAPHNSLSKQMPADKDVLPSLDGQRLGLAQCIDIALTRNPNTRASWQRARSAAAGVGQARSAYFPSADFTAGATRSNYLSLYSRQQTGSVNTLNAGFGVRYLLFDGGVRSAKLKGAEAELLKADFQHNTTLQDVALNVEESYYRLLADKALERVAKQTIRQTQYHIDVAQARHKNGLVAKSDVLKAATEKANADLLLVRARSQVRIARGQLANAMGLKPSESFKVNELPQKHHQRELADIKHLMAEAETNHPKLRADLARVASDRAKINAAKARYWPEVTLNTNYGWQDRTFVSTNKVWSLGLNVTWSIFDGFNRRYTVSRTESDLAETIAKHDKMLHDIDLEVWTAYSKLIEADEVIKAARVLVASAEENVRVTEGQYKNGIASIIEVTDAQTTRTTANVQLVQASLNWYTGMVRLEWSVGRTLARATPHNTNGEN